MSRVALILAFVCIAANASSQQQAKSKAEKAIAAALKILEDAAEDAKGTPEYGRLAKAIDALRASQAPDESGKVTRDNYAKITLTMSRPRVEAILGKGKEVSSFGRFTSVRWTGKRAEGARPIEINITFRAILMGDPIVDSKNISDD